MSSDWQPTATLNNLKQRVRVIQQIRAFLDAKGYLEVDTPLLCHATVPDPTIQSFKTNYEATANSSKTLYLQTSPEFGMKRLLAAGSGPIYQICKAFRNGESGRYHNPEFTMLEFYRPGFDHHDLMDETDELFQQVLGAQPAARFSYLAIFMKYLEIDPFTASNEELLACAKTHALELTESLALEDKDTLLQLLLSHLIEPQFQELTFIYDFPVSQAALAKIREESPPVGERFEAYFKGIELANGFHELTNATEQRQRFLEDLDKRKQLNLHTPPLDEHLLESLNHLPNCAGIAVGIDRLVMLATKSSSIEQVLSFPLDNA